MNPELENEVVSPLATGRLAAADCPGAEDLPGFGGEDSG